MKKGFLLVAIAPILLFGVVFVRHYAGDPQVDAASKTNSGAAPKLDAVGLQSALEAIVKQQDVSVSVSVYDVTSKQQVQAGLQGTVFRGASTTKVLTAAAYLHAVEQGRASFDADDQTRMQAMLQQSDNSAWQYFNDTLTQAGLTSYAQNIGLKSFDVSTNTLTAADEATLLAKLYQRQLLTTDHTQFVLSAMRDTNNETLIPAAVPAGTTVYHKYGELDGELHDAAVVRYQGRTFALVIYTNNERDTLDDGADRLKLIHALTSTVLQYESKEG